MATEQFFTLVALLLTAANASLTYFNFRHNRKKDFQDKLYQLKLEAYKELNDACYLITRSLDINSSPFVEIYEFEDKKEWIKYCEQNMGNEISKGFDIQKLTYKYSLILPSNIIDKYYDFTNQCIAFVTMSYHFDTSLIIHNQENLWDLYIELLNEFRKDLKIESIDSSLKKRIS